MSSRLQLITLATVTLLFSLAPHSLLSIPHSLSPVQAQTAPSRKTPQAWQEFTSNEGGFRVEMPGQPKKEVTPSKVEDEPTVYQFVFTTDTIGYIVQYFDVPSIAEDSEEEKNQFVEQAPKLFVDGMGGQVLSQQTIQLNEFFGKEFVYTAPDGIIGKARIYLVNSRIYTVVVIGSTDADLSLHGDRFLDSFQLLQPTTTPPNSVRSQTSATTSQTVNSSEETADRLVQQEVKQDPAQTAKPKNPELSATQSIVSGNFVDYFAEEAQLKGHGWSVNSASFSPNGQWIVTAGADGTGRVWDSSGKMLVELRGHSESVRSAAFSPDSQRIVTASLDGTARVWNLSGQQLVEINGQQGKMFSASFSPDGKRIVTAGENRSVRIWDNSGKLLAEFKGHTGSVYSVSFSPDGKQVVSASADRTARVWDMSGKVVVELKGHQDTVWSASFSPDGQRIVTGSDDRTARIWDLSGRQVGELKQHSDSVFSANWSLDGKRIITASGDSTVLLWEASGQLIGKVQGHEGSVNSASLSSDSKWILTTSSDGTARLWDTSSKLLTELQGYRGFSPDGKLIIASQNNTSYLWELSQKQVIEFKGIEFTGAGRASFSPDGRLILIESGEGIQVWNTEGRQLGLLIRQKDEWGISDPKFSSDGQRILTSSGDGSAQLWNTSGQLLATLKANPENTDSVKANFSPDGKYVVTIAPIANLIRVWDSTGNLIAEIEGKDDDNYMYQDPSFSPDSKRILVPAGRKHLSIWSISGKLVGELKADEDINNGYFSPDGQHIVAESTDGIIYLWNTSGKLVAEFNGLFSSFSPSGKYIVTTTSVSPYGTVQVWDTLGKMMLTLNGNKEVTNTSFSVDEKQLLTEFSDDTARIWYLSGELKTQTQLFTAEIQPPFEESGNYSNKIIFSPNGQRIVTVLQESKDSEEKTIRLWDFSGKLLAVLKKQKYGPDSVAFSPDGKHIIIPSIGGDTVDVWDTNGKLRTEFKFEFEKEFNPFGGDISFSADSQLIVTVKGYASYVWKQVWDNSGNLRRQPTLMAELKHGDKLYQSISSADISPDGKLVVTASQDATARVWDTSGNLLTILKGHQGEIKSASFSPDSKLIVTTSFDNTARVWDVSGNLLSQLPKAFYRSARFSPTGQQVLTVGAVGIQLWTINGELLTTFKVYQRGLDRASFSPDGKRIFTGSFDGTVRIWDLNGKLLSSLDLFAPSSSLKAQADRLRDLKFSAPNCAAAFEPWQKALKIYQDTADRENQVLMLEKIGNAYYCLGDYTNAITSLSQALSLAQKFNYRNRQVSVLNSLGTGYNTLADYDRAIQQYSQAIDLLNQYTDLIKDAGISQKAAEILQGRGNAYYVKGQFEETFRDYFEALEIAKQDANISAIARTQISLADIYSRIQDYSKATQYYKEALQSNPSEALAGLGNIDLAQGNVTRALERHQQSLTIARQNANKEAEGTALNNLAITYRQAGDLPKAEANLQEAINVWESLRSKVLEDRNKVSIFEKQSSTYRLLQSVQVEQNKLNAALETTERGRSRAFVELLAKRLVTNKATAERNKQASVRVSPPSVSSDLESVAKPPTMQQIQQTAKAQNADLVQYSIIYDDFKIQGKEELRESELYIWVIQPTGEITFRKADLKPLWQQQNASLEKLVEQSRETIGARGRSDVGIVAGAEAVQQRRDQQLRNLKQLHQLLIEPIANLLPKDPNQRVIFMPQGELFLVPFPALLDANNTALIEKHTIQTAPSIQVLELIHQRRQGMGSRDQGTGKALVVGNPVMPKVRTEAGGSVTQLSPLAGAEWEAKQIADLLKTKAIIGSQATKSNVLKQLSQARFIHFATHGLLDDFRGLGVPGAIALAPDNTGKVNDGLLTSDEILDLKLNAELVVLSACDTGRGRLTGDGVIGLSRSLITAGVPSIIVSLWKVPDQSTAFLMTQFYKNLQQNPDKAQALRQAMLSTKAKYPDPLDWAAFTLIGESQ